MKLQILSFCSCLLSLPAMWRCDDLLETPIVAIEMSTAGFHRDLQYTVQFDYPLAGKECEYVLQQPLPAAVYVSVDQLDDLKRLNKLNAIYPAFVDVEKSTEHAAPFTVLLKGTPKITDNLKLPIHFRYHAPSDKSTFAIVDIATPTMYMNCPDSDNDLIDSELQQPLPNTKYCLDEKTIDFVQYQSSYSPNHVDDENCNWKLIKAHYRLKTPLRAEIPVGNAKAFPPILYATIILSWIVSLWTIFRTNHVPRRINLKLEEQRILQKKNK